MAPGPLVVDADPALRDRLERLAREARLVFFAGLPGTGKSLLVQQLAGLAHAAGRAVHLLQWDVARPVFEAAPAGRRYPMVAGITHVVVRRAAGLWARGAVAAWGRAHAAAGALLVGETPFVGHRFVELARPAADEAEPLLADPACRFVIPVPSPALRRHLEAERARRAAAPVHPLEREDAPPDVLRAMWRELAAAARPVAADPDPPYDPAVYQGVYERVLRHRRTEALALDTVLPTARTSVYILDVPHQALVPTHAEVEEALAAVEARYPDLALLEAEAARWHEA